MLQQNNAAAIFSTARSMYLPDVAAALGFKFIKGANKFFSNTCPNCGEGRAGGNAVSIFLDKSEVWRWSCFCCTKGGTSIDFAAYALGLPDFDAAKHLVREKLAPVVIHSAVQCSADAAAEIATAKALAESVGIILAKGFATETNVRAYLLERKISDEVQDEAFRRGLIRMLPSDPRVCMEWLRDEVGDDRLRQAGLWKVGAKWPAIAFRPIVSIFPGAQSAEFRIARPRATEDEPKSIRYGKLKWPLWWKGAAFQPDPKIVVIEGVMDLLSLVQMQAKEHLMAIPGVRAWNKQWIKQAAEKNGCKTGVVGVDRDPTGDLVAGGMVNDVIEVGLLSYRKLPEAKDWNADLMNGRKSFT